MRCPYCESRDSKVIDSRASDNGVRRRRECIWCGERFSTLESVQRASVQIAKKDGRRESFQREKLFAGLQTACRKRPVPTAEIEAIVADIEARLAADSRPEVPSSLIGEMAMEALRDLDHIAYVRFASVYRGFADLDSLRRAVDELEAGHDPGWAHDSLQLPLLDDEAETGPGDGIRPQRAAGLRVV